MKRRNFLRFLDGCFKSLFIGLNLKPRSAEKMGTKYQPAAGKIMSRWAKEVSPENALPEYPRPQMMRKEWLNLNGLWEYAVRPKAETDVPKNFDGNILVPFCIGSSLSGVGKQVTPDQTLWYKLIFDIPKEWKDKHILLHFGAVDWHARIWVNGNKAGEHKGGYTPFSFDITDMLKKNGTQELLLSVWDPTDTWSQPRGKQITEPKRIWYTAVTGIWQTVWLEPVPEYSIKSIVPVPDIDKNVLNLFVTTQPENAGREIEAIIKAGTNLIIQKKGKAGEPLSLPIKEAKLWSPDDPFLYGLEVNLISGNKTVDSVTGYFGMRKISRTIDEFGFQRLMLNNKVLFQYGPLDQGMWPDGLYTAPTDEALKYDIVMTKKFGFNMARKHVKVEPARWYYHCDREGLLIWQDMPSGFITSESEIQKVKFSSDKDWDRPRDSAEQFENELKELINNFQCFPSIIMWVVFNEGWGQYDTNRITEMVKKLDPSRLVDGGSGWADRGRGDVIDLHQYPGPGMAPPELHKRRAVVQGEFGGLGLPAPGHLWKEDKKNWGYQNFDDRKKLFEKYRRLMDNLRPMIHRGLAAAVYTQTTDVEIEVNGLMSYDREVNKFEPEELKRLHLVLYKPAKSADVIAPDSEFKKQKWQYITRKPIDRWKDFNFDPDGWKDGEALFGGEKFLGSIRGTVYKGPNIWLRREFQIKQVRKGLSLRFYCNGKITVYLNGALVFEEDIRGKRHYMDYNISSSANILKQGKNIMAVHYSNSKGPNAVDGGLYDYDPD